MPTTSRTFTVNAVSEHISIRLSCCLYCVGQTGSGLP
jgi:hypothetical protein